MRKPLHFLAEISPGSPTLSVVEEAALVMRTSPSLVGVSAGRSSDEAPHYRYPGATGFQLYQLMRHWSETCLNFDHWVAHHGGENHCRILARAVCRISRSACTNFFFNGNESAYQSSAIIKRDTHVVVDKLEHLTVFREQHVVTPRSIPRCTQEELGL